jgi:hypothetical protein
MRCNKMSSKLGHSALEINSRDRLEVSLRAVHSAASTVHKYLRITEETTMPQTVEPTAPEAQRAIIRQSINEIAAEVGTALRDARLDFPVFLTVPTSGYSFATMACPLDPSDEDWSHASAIVCRIIGKRLGDVQLRGRALHCAVANAAVSASEVMADTGNKE